MSQVTVTKKNESIVRVHAEPSILQELSGLFEFEVPGAKFSPKYKSGFWNGRIKLFHMLSGELPLGLVSKVYAYCKESGYEFTGDYDIVREDLTEDEWNEFIDHLTFCSKGEPIAAHSYQVDSVFTALTRGRAILLSPTGSGKSLMLYMMVRWHEIQERKQLIIVPSVQLVEQMYNDFDDYATEDTWDVSNSCVKIYGGKEKTFDKNVTIATWQTLITMPKVFFEQFDVVYGDEVHGAKAKSLTDILNWCVNAGFRVGTTGTLDGTKVNKLVLEGLFGPVVSVTTTKKLMDADTLAELTITGLVFQYPDEQRKYVANHAKKYTEEVDFIVKHDHRNAFITDLALSRKGNTLVLFQFVEKHGRVLYDIIKEKLLHDSKGRKVFFVHGGVGGEEREDIRAIVGNETDAIIVASFGTMSQGVNIPTLQNIIVASSTKSRIRILQSIGRGLRRTDEKTTCTVYDLGDDLSWKSRQNYSLLHFIERIKTYAEENFTYVVRPVQLELE
jgi:superfamily II DNA or RNA helicase